MDSSTNIAKFIDKEDLGKTPRKDNMYTMLNESDCIQKEEIEDKNDEISTESTMD